ncbi:ABC transporter ATP-binding protein [Salinigranum salinum]|uniref:ABC transporter ATP-binding protein n=1 Tax=Salinigranum salinum TaxID=1364937 RepID=UPI00126113CC
MNPEQSTVARCIEISHEYDRRRTSSMRRLLGRRRGGSAVTALRDVSLRLNPGEFVGLAGPSGSGKSTLLHLLSGLDVPTDGRVELLGTDTRTLSPAGRAALRLRHVGIVFQRFYLLPTLSARANVALPLVERGVSRSTRRDRATSALEAVGLDDRLSHRPGELSGGEQQRVAIARALVTDPDLLVADEPTGELDSATGERIIDLLADVATDRSVVVASHDDAVLERTDRTVRLHDGRVAHA